jgi:hypothetical protein
MLCTAWFRWSLPAVEPTGVVAVLQLSFLTAHRRHRSSIGTCYSPRKTAGRYGGLADGFLIAVLGEGLLHQINRVGINDSVMFAIKYLIMMPHLARIGDVLQELAKRSFAEQHIARYA